MMLQALMTGIPQHVNTQHNNATCKPQQAASGWCRVFSLQISAVQVQTALGAIVREPAARELPCGVFGSFGWSGEAVDELENRLKVRP